MLSFSRQFALWLFLIIEKGSSSKKVRPLAYFEKIFGREMKRNTVRALRP